MDERSMPRGVNLLKRKHPGGHASLPAEAVSTPGRVLAAALLADTLPGPPRAHPSRRVTASLAMRWAHPPAGHAPNNGRFERVSGLAPYIGVQGRIRDPQGRLVATSFALFAQLPSGVAPTLARAGVGAGPVTHSAALEPGPVPSVDEVGLAMAESIRAAAVTPGPASLPELRVTIPVRAEWLNKIGILHGASGTALLVMAGSVAAVGHDSPWPRVADLYLRFLEPVQTPEVTIVARVVRQSARTVDVEVALEMAGLTALTGRLLLVTGRAGGRAPESRPAAHSPAQFMDTRSGPGIQSGPAPVRTSPVAPSWECSDGLRPAGGAPDAAGHGPQLR